MEIQNTKQWLLQNNRRKRVLGQFTQPLTARQMSKRVGLNLDTCRHLLSELALRNQIYCLNNASKRSRLYWLTPQGRINQKAIVSQGVVRPQTSTFIDSKENTLLIPNKRPQDDDTAEGSLLWKRYGFICYNHRANVILAMRTPMSPSQIKRKAKQRNPKIRMNANNVRDVLRLLLARKIVTRHVPKGQTRPLYELTAQGRAFQKLLQLAEVPN